MSRQWIVLKDGSYGIQISGFVMSGSFTDIKLYLAPGFRRDSMYFSINSDGTRIDFKVIDVPVGSCYSGSPL